MGSEYIAGRVTELRWQRKEHDVVALLTEYSHFSHSATLFGLLYPADEQTTVFKMSTTIHKPTKCNIIQGFSKRLPTFPTRE